MLSYSPNGRFSAQHFRIKKPRYNFIMKQWTTLMLARSGIIAALYVALTYACLPVASGAIQFRLSEMLTVLPLFYVEAIPALTIGCLLSNIISGCSVWDIFLGTAITLVAATGTYYAGKIFRHPAPRILLGGAFPVFLNALGLPLIWILAGAPDLVYLIEVGYLTLSQGVIIWGLGCALYLIVTALLKKNVSALKPVPLSELKK